MNKRGPFFWFVFFGQAKTRGVAELSEAKMNK